MNEEEVVLVICVDNSQGMTNCDYSPGNRWESQYYTIFRYIEDMDRACGAHYTVYIISMADSPPSVLKIISSKDVEEEHTPRYTMQSPMAGDTCNIVDALSISHLIFRTKAEDTYKKHLVIFSGSPLQTANISPEWLSSEALFFKKNKIGLEIVCFGDGDMGSFRSFNRTCDSLDVQCILNYVKPEKELVIEKIIYKKEIDQILESVSPLSRDGSQKTLQQHHQEQKEKTKQQDLIANGFELINSKLALNNGGSSCRRQGAEARLYRSKFLQYNLLLDYHQNNKKETNNNNNNNNHNIDNPNTDTNISPHNNSNTINPNNTNINPNNSINNPNNNNNIHINPNNNNNSININPNNNNINVNVNPNNNNYNFNTSINPNNNNNTSINPNNNSININPNNNNNKNKSNEELKEELLEKRRRDYFSSINKIASVKEELSSLSKLYQEFEEEKKKLGEATEDQVERHKIMTKELFQKLFLKLREVSENVENYKKNHSGVYDEEFNTLLLEEKKKKYTSMLHSLGAASKPTLPTSVMFLYKRSKVLVEFPAGLCELRKPPSGPLPADGPASRGIVYSLAEKGHFSLIKIGVTNFQIVWRNLETMKVEQQLFFEYSEATCKMVSNGQRVLFFKFNIGPNSTHLNTSKYNLPSQEPIQSKMTIDSDGYLFLWPQYQESSRDDYFINQLNHYINSSQLTNAAKTKKQYLMRIFSAFAPQLSQSVIHNAVNSGNSTSTASYGNFTTTATLHNLTPPPKAKPQPYVYRPNNSPSGTIGLDHHELQMRSQYLLDRLDRISGRTIKPVIAPPPTPTTPPTNIFKSKFDKVDSMANWTYTPLSSEALKKSLMPKGSHSDVLEDVESIPFTNDHHQHYQHNQPISDTQLTNRRGGNSSGNLNENLVQEAFDYFDHLSITPPSSSRKRSDSWNGIDSSDPENRKRVLAQLDKEDQEAHEFVDPFQPDPPENKNFFQLYKETDSLPYISGDLSSPSRSPSLSSSPSTSLIDLKAVSDQYNDNGGIHSQDIEISSTSSSSTNSNSSSPTRLVDTVKSNSKISLFQPNPLSSIPIPLPISSGSGSLSSSGLLSTSTGIDTSSATSLSPPPPPSATNNSCDIEMSSLVSDDSSSSGLSSSNSTPNIHEDDSL